MDFRLYGISCRRLSPFPDLNRYLSALFHSPADLIQLREKDLSIEALRRLVRRAVLLSRETGKVLVVNTHVELALEEGAGGVHLPWADSLPAALRLRNRWAGKRPGADRRPGEDLVRPKFLIGQSVHSKPEALQAAAEGADYLLLGPIFAPLSKADSRTPLGLAILQETASAVPIPVFALGGLERSHFPALEKAGAAGPAGITWLHRELREFR